MMGETGVSELRPLRDYGSPCDLRCGPWMMILTGANSQHVSARAFWEPPVGLLSGLCVSRDVSGSHQYRLVYCHPRRLWSDWEVSEGNENLVYPSPWDFKRSFTRCKILRHGTSGFTSHPKEGVLLIFIALKNPTPLPGSNSQLLSPVASTLTTAPPGDKAGEVRLAIIF
jgi:hypothetical protein